MGLDEEATHTKLAALLTDAVDPAVAEHGGRIVKNTGDGFLAEFASAVEAVRAAVQFQTRIKELTIDEVEDSRIAFRVGINIGDVIVEPHDIFGDDVNIAARLEGIAEPGGICISSTAYDYVEGKVGARFVDLGEQNLKNIARPVRAYALVRDELSLPTRGSSPTPSTPLAPRLSIVVLPFANIGGDPEQDYFVDGVTESLTTDLSRVSGAFVITRNTAFAFKGKNEDVRVVGYLKPIPTLKKALRSVDMITKEPFVAQHERSDTCTVPAAGVIGESMVALVLARAFLEKFGGDSLEETTRNYSGYLEQLRSYPDLT
jgi:hypothetical protein